jgi:DNA-binding transcriptional MocR family regulator
LQELLPTSVGFVPPEGGYFIWLELPQTIDAYQLRKDALAVNLDFKPGPIFSCEGRFRNHIRLCCTFLDETKLQLACERLANLLKKST